VLLLVLGQDKAVSTKVSTVFIAHNGLAMSSAGQTCLLVQFITDHSEPFLCLLFFFNKDTNCERNKRVGVQIQQFITHYL
jgi:hypothetical protein